MKKLEGKIALVTAATKGIGLGCAKKLALEGAYVYIGARSKDLAMEIIDDINYLGGSAHYVYFDAKNSETYEEMINTIVTNSKSLDILVNNYGSTDVLTDKDLKNTSPKDFIDIVNKNLESVYRSCYYAIPVMEKNNGGSIINISSIGSIVPDLSRISYCVSKAAINSLTQNIALQYARQNIRCNAILPGLIATNAALEHMSDNFRSSFLKHVPIGRMGTSEDIANAALYLASDDSSFVTGSIIEVAGGFGLGTPQFAEFLNL